MPTQKTQPKEKELGPLEQLMESNPLIKSGVKRVQKNQDAMIDEATQAGVPASEILKTLLEQHSGANQTEQPGYSTKPASSPFGFGGASMQDGNVVEQKPGMIAGLLMTLLSGNPDAKAKMDMGKMMGVQKLQNQGDFGLKQMEIPEGFEVAGYDQKGNPMIRKKQETSVEKASGKVQGTAAAEANLVVGKANILMDLFDDARNEAKSVFPNIGKEDFTGKTSGFGAKQMGRVNKLPKVIAYQAKKKTFATTIAKAAGEVRPTDEDIKRFMEALPDISLPDETNKILLTSMYQELESQGAKNVWEKFGKKSVSTTQNSGGFRVIGVR